MTDKMPDVGVNLVAQKDAEFKKAMEDATKSVEKFGEEAQKATTQAGSGASGVADAVGALGGVLGQAGSKAGGFADILMGVGTTLGMAGAVAGIAAVAIGTVLVGAVMAAVAGFAQLSVVAGQYIYQSTMLAAGQDKLERALYTVGNNAGYSTDALVAQTKSLTDLGMSSQQATTALTDYVQKDLDLAQATNLATVAQDLAAVKGGEVTDVMNSLTTAITGGTDQALKAMGLDINRTQVYQQYAQTLGKSAQALTDTEKQQAMLNATIAAGSEVAGAYASSMQNPISQLQNFQQSLSETSLNVGEPFLDAFTTATTALAEIGAKFQEATSAGGALYPIIIALAAAAELIAEAFAGNAGTGVDFLINKFVQLGTWLGNFAVKAFEWGSNIVIQLATGIINAASSVLISAMNFIGNVLSSFLSANSPPRVAPDLPEWGMNAMNEWLGGFTKADFGMLTSIQSSMSSFLQSLVSGGKITEQESAKTFLSITKDLMESLSTGTLNEGMFDKMQKSMGVYGTELGKLIRSHFDLAIAMKAVDEAQKTIENSQKTEAKAIGDMNRIMSEYNVLLRAGASPQVLAAKREEFRLASDTQKSAANSIALAEDAIDANAEKISSLKEQISLQDSINQQLLTLSQWQQKLKKPIEIAIVPKLPDLAKALGGGGGGAFGGFGDAFKTEIENSMDSAKTAMDTAIEDMKKKITNKINELIAPWITFKEDVNKQIDEVKKKWEEFAPIVQQFYDENIAPALLDIRTDLDDTFGAERVDKVGNLMSKLALISPALAGLSAGAGVGAIGLSQVHAWLGEKIPEAIAIIQPKLDELKTTFREKLVGAVQTFKEKIADIKSAFQTYILTPIDNVKSKFDEFKDAIAGETVDRISVLKDNMQFLKDQVEPVSKAFESFKGFLGSIGELLSTVFDVFFPIFVGHMENLLGFVLDLIDPLGILTGEFQAMATDFFTETISGLWGEIVYNFGKFKDILEILNPFVETAGALFSILATNWVNDKIATKSGEISSSWNTFAKALEDINGIVSGVTTGLSNLVKAWITDKILGIVQGLAEGWKKIKEVFTNLGQLFDEAAGAIDRLTASFLLLQIPEWLMPGSPSPLENALNGVATALGIISTIKIPALFDETTLAGLAYLWNIFGGGASLMLAGIQSLTVALLAMAVILMEMFILPLQTAFQTFLTWFQEVFVLAFVMFYTTTLAEMMLYMDAFLAYMTDTFQASLNNFIMWFESVFVDAFTRFYMITILELKSKLEDLRLFLETVFAVEITKTTARINTLAASLSIVATNAIRAAQAMTKLAAAMAVLNGLTTPGENPIVGNSPPIMGTSLKYITASAKQASSVIDDLASSIKGTTSEISSGGYASPPETRNFAGMENGNTTNQRVYNVNVNAAYANTQMPGNIKQDLMNTLRILR